MKKIIILLAMASVSVIGTGQGNGHGKGHDKDKNNSHHEPAEQHNRSSQEGYEKHQPKKVVSAFYRDYPNASNVSWSKYKGDYTATFSNGIWRSTAVYHANGERRDTRTTVTRKQLPGTIWDKIFKRDNIVPVAYVQIERPAKPGNIFRILSSNNQVYFYDPDGNRISYNY